MLHVFVTIITICTVIRALLLRHRATISRIYTVDISRDVFLILWRCEDDKGCMMRFAQEVFTLCRVDNYTRGTGRHTQLFRDGYDYYRVMITYVQLRFTSSFTIV